MFAFRSFTTACSFGSSLRPVCPRSVAKCATLDQAKNAIPPRMPARIFLPITSLLRFSALYAATGEGDSQRGIRKTAGDKQFGADHFFRVPVRMTSVKWAERSG